MIETANTTMTMTPFALSLLGVESGTRTTPGQEAGDTMASETRQHRESRAIHGRHGRRTTSYSNAFQTTCSPSHDEPPSYVIAARQRPVARREFEREVLPGYTCTVEAEAKVLLHHESTNPFHRIYTPEETDWREAYVVLRGTLLSLHKVKDGKAGRLMQSYTLQHAEIGTAADTKHTVLVPQSRFARCIPTSHKRKAWTKDPTLFKPERQHILRLRLESEQLLLAHPSEEFIQDLTSAISAGIDISTAIDERSPPRQCTVPRRNRRRNGQRNATPADMNDPTLLAEQERILRSMYPAFAESRGEATASRPLLSRMTSEGSAMENSPNGRARTRMGDEDEIDMAAVREDFAEPGRRAALSRPTTASASTTAFVGEGMIYATAPSNFNSDGKWEPAHTRTPQQTQRYIRRCQPVLLAESARASDIIIHHGRRRKINWRMQLMEDWELQPPTYKSHNFDEMNLAVEEEEELVLERTNSLSQNSDSGSATRDTLAPVSTLDSGENEDSQDEITPAGNVAHVILPKIMAADKESRRGRKTQEIPLRHREGDAYEAVLCV